MMNRYREVWFFWRTHLASIIAILIPVALIEGAARVLLGEPLTFTEAGAFQINWSSAFALLFTRSLVEAQLLILFARSIGASTTEKNTEPGIWPLSLQLLPIVLLANLLVFAAVGFGFTLLIFPGIWLFVRLAFTQCEVVIERRSALEAIQNSFRLSAGNVQWELMPMWLLMVMMLQLPLLMLSGLLNSVGLSEQTLGLALLLPSLLLNSLPQVLIFRYYQLVRAEPR